MRADNFFMYCSQLVQLFFELEKVYVVRLKVCNRLVGTQKFSADMDFLQSASNFISGQIVNKDTVTNFLDIMQLDQELSGEKQKTKSSKILLVEDSHLFRKMTSRYLETFGFEVLKAANGLEALDVLNTNDGVNLILSDLEMPEMNGFELAAQLKAQPKFKIPLLALTSLNSDSVREQARSFGFDDFIVKYNSADLIKKLEVHIL